MSRINIYTRHPKKVRVSHVDTIWSANYSRILRYSVELTHLDMNLFKVLSAPDMYILQSKVDAHLAQWDDRYDNFIVKQQLLSGKEAADELTANAIKQQDSLKHILAHTLRINDAINWDSLKDRSRYNMPDSFPVDKPQSLSIPQPEYVAPKIGFFDILFGKKAKIVAKANEQFAEAVSLWEGQEASRKAKLEEGIALWERQKADFWEEHARRSAEFLREQANSHAKVDAFRDLVNEGDPDAVTEMLSLVLEKSDYDGLFEKSYTLQYHPNDKTLLLSYNLPNPDDLPQVKSVKFVRATGELSEVKISDRDKKANFDSAIYQVCLRTIHEIFEADVDNNIDNLLFNGMVNFVDPATGKDHHSCIMSVLVKKDQFMEIDLSRVDPKSCFKSLKGVSAASLAALTPIAPIMEMDREDRRFIEARELSGSIDPATNLASMSWEDFEHLVRELFEKEFLSSGGEVKVTRSSSDGGVDAIAFDPDPIRGGKIVIQAKRYTRTVGVAAVRDLYGTVMNEGASKGILVTTADYGPDAYSFANGKPLTLLSGANLLHLLEKHGYQAHIDIRAARAAMA